MNRVALFAPAAAFALIAATGGCEDDDTDDGIDGGGDHTLRFELTNVAPLGPGSVYEGWAIIAEGAVSTGRFTVDMDGRTDPESFTIPRDQLEEITAFVITIEPEVGDDPAPAAAHLLAGDREGDEQTSELTTAHPAAIGTDFASAAGTFILATPSTAENMDDEGQGIWWLVPAAAGETPAPSLELPELPAGWTYEGWVVGADGPASTGTFDRPDVVDSDGVGPNAGPDPGPPFPGQDFIEPPLVLDDGTFAAVISVEPKPDDSAAPFSLKPLVLDPIGREVAPASQTMTNVAATSLPSGIARIE